MAADKTTETRRDSDKLPKSLSIGDILKWAKGNPLVLAALALGSGTGGQEVLARIGQQVEWWQIALAVVGYGLMQYLADSAKRQEKLDEKIGKVAEGVMTLKTEVATIHTRLDEGEKRMDRMTRPDLAVEGMKGRRPKSQEGLRPVK